MFSKAWVLSLLVKAVEAVDYHEKASGSPETTVRESGSKQQGETVMDDDIGATGRSCSGGSNKQPLLGRSGDEEEKQRPSTKGAEDERASEVGEVERSVERAEDDSREISESLENDLCRLWDASMNPVSLDNILYFSCCYI